MKCPKCSDSNLSNETYEGVTIDRCPTCKGTWLDEGELTDIVEIEEKKFGVHLKKETLTDAFPGTPEEHQHTNVNCPKCNTKMNSLNYVYDSGVIIENCPQNHGVWLDIDEIEKVQIYKEEWKKKAATRKDELTTILKDVKKSEERRLDAQKDGIASKYILSSVVRKILDHI